MMRSAGSRDRRQQFWLVGIGDVEDVEGAGLGGGDIKAVDCFVETHFQRETLAGFRKIEHLLKSEVLAPRTPSSSPQGSAIHIVDVGDLGLSMGDEGNFDRRISRRRRFMRE